MHHSQGTLISPKQLAKAGNQKNVESKLGLDYTVIRKEVTFATNPTFVVAALVHGFGGFSNGYRNPDDLSIERNGNLHHL